MSTGDGGVEMRGWGGLHRDEEREGSWKAWQTLPTWLGYNIWEG